MSDVTGVLLTRGEPGTRRALDSLQDQEPQLHDVIVVRGVSPFSAALNHAAERVRTPFFVQVDSDMTLDPGCVRTLREAMSPEIGIAAGLLRDPLIGEVGAVKLFRRACFDRVRLRDTVATDVDFYRELAGHGLLTLYVLPEGMRSVGEHAPEYSAAYTYSTYYLLGARYWLHRDLTTLRWRYRRLRASTHARAPLARVALGHGLFSREERDVAKESIQLPEILAELTSAGAVSASSQPNGSEPAAACERWFACGRRLAQQRALSELTGALGALGTDIASWPLEASVAHGFVSVLDGSEAGGSPWARLRQLH